MTCAALARVGRSVESLVHNTQRLHGIKNIAVREPSKGLIMKSDAGEQVRLTQGMRLIFDQASPTTPSSLGSRSRSSSCSSHRSRYRRPRHRSSSSPSPSRTRSRSHPRCRHRCRARSRSYSPSPDRLTRGRGRTRSRTRSHTSQRHHSGSRNHSRLSSHKRTTREFVNRSRCRFPPSPRRSYRNRSRSRSPEYSAVRLSLKEKMDLLNVAKENAAKVLGERLLELPASVHQKPNSSIEEGVKAARGPLKGQSQDEGKANEVEEHAPRRSPVRRLITFSIKNTVAKPSSSSLFHVTESKVTSRADSMGNRKPYGHWVPVKKTSPNKL